MARGRPLGCRSRSLNVREREQKAQEQVRGGEDQVGAVRTSLQNQHHNGNAEAEFFKHRRQHQRPKASGVRGDEEKRKLPGQRQPNETEEKPGMSDGRWILPPDHVEEEIQRGNNQEAPYPGDPEHHFSESHGPPWCILRNMTAQGLRVSNALPVSRSTGTDMWWI